MRRNGGSDPARSPSQEARLLRDLLAATERPLTAAEERAHVRKAHVLVELKMIGPVTDEEITARVRVAVAGAPGVVESKVEALL